MNAQALAISRLLVGTLAVLGLSSDVIAADWRIQYGGVSPRLIYTDNVCLDDEDKESAWIESVSLPTLSLKSNNEDSRVNVDFVGGLRLDTLGDNSNKCNNRNTGNGNRNNNSTSPIPTFRLTTNAELIENWLSLSAFANARQNRTDSFRAGGNDGLNRSGNVNTTYNYGIRPSLRRRFFDIANLSLQSNYNAQENTDAERDNSTSASANGRVTSVAEGGASTFNWAVSGKYRVVEYQQDNDDEEDNELISALLTLGYKFNRKFQLTVSAGKEWNEFATTSTDDKDGNQWNAKITWSPNDRIRLQIGQGDRFFGTTPSLNLSYKHKRSTITAAYQRGLNFSRDLRGSGDLFNETDSFGEAVDFLGGQQDFFQGTPTSDSRSPIVNESFSLAYNLRGVRSSIRINGRQSVQTRTEDGQESTFNSVGVNASRQLGQNFSLSSRISWQDQQEDRTDGGLTRDSETWRLTLGLSRSLGASTRLALNYGYTDRDSELASDIYTENRLTLSLNLRL